MSKWTKVQKAIVIVLTVVLALALLVPLALSFFAFPLPGDDFANTVHVVEAIKQDGTVASVFVAAVDRAADMYMRIQGNFSGVLLMALNPLLISVSAYQWVLFFINLVLMVGVVLFFMRMLKQHWHMPAWVVWFLALLTLFIAYNRVMSLLEFGYNYISAGYYTLSFALALLFAALALRLVGNPQKPHVLPMILMVLISAYIGLNNFPLAIMFVAALFLLMLYAVIKKHKLWRRFLVLFIVFVVFFALSLFAPGNARRANTEWTESTGLLTAVIGSVVLSLQLIFNACVSTPLLGALLLLTPVFSKAAKTSKANFVHPLLLMAASYAVFVAQYIPVMYASGYDFHSRIENIKWLSCLMMIVLNYINLVGFVAKRRLEKPDKGFKAATAVLGVALVLFSWWAYYLAPTKIDDALFVHRMNYEIIAEQATNGQLKTYRQEQWARFDVLQDDTVKDVELEPLTYDTVICGLEMLSEDKEANRNRVLALHYDKNYIVVKPRP